jgi:DNA-directed RNA polymerase subunit RPC12/RpoP
VGRRTLAPCVGAEFEERDLNCLKVVGNWNTVRRSWSLDPYGIARKVLSEGIVVNAAYIEQWKKMRRARRRFVLAVLAFPIGLVVNHYLIDPTNRLTASVAIFGLGCFSFFLLATSEYRNLRCPRCGQLWQNGFHAVRRCFLVLRHRCPHCGLRLP